MSMTKSAPAASENTDSLEKIDAKAIGLASESRFFNKA
jgi:hypothetical protein